MTSTNNPSYIQSEWIKELLTALAKATQDDPFLNHQEGHFNLSVAKALIKSDAKLQFGTTDKNKANFFSKKTGWTNEKRQHKIERGSGDLTIIEPALTCLELKCRPDYGPKAQADFQEIADDLDRIIDNPQSSFLFSFDHRLYGSFDGTAKKRKKSDTGDRIKSFFTTATELPDGKVIEGESTWADSKVETWSLKTVTSTEKFRFFIFGRRK